MVFVQHPLEFANQAPADSGQRAREDDETTLRLLHSAIIVFGEQGYDGASVSAIARRCGLTTGAIYARWTGKHEMFLAVIRYAHKQRMLLQVKEAAATTYEKLAILAASLIAPSLDETRNLWLEACITASRDPSFHPAIAELQALESADFAEIVDEGKATGVIDPSLSTRAIVYLCQSLGLGAYLDLRVQSEDHIRPPADEWFTLMTRIIDSLKPNGAAAENEVGAG